MIKKTFYIAFIGLAIIGYIIYDSRKKPRGSDIIEREKSDTLPDNLQDVFNTLSALNYELTTNKKGDIPSITFKTNANGLNYSVIVKGSGQVLIYDGVSGTPFVLRFEENAIKNQNGITVSEGDDIANGILQIINNKDYL